MSDIRGNDYEMDILLELQRLGSIRQTKMIFKQYEDAIRIAEESISLAEKAGLQTHVQSLRNFIFLVQNDLRSQKAK